MKKAVNSRCRTVALLLTLILLAWCAGNALAQSEAKAGALAASSPADSMSPEKRKKLDNDLRHALSDYNAGRFERAVQWYKGALQLDAGNEDVRRSLENAQRMLDSQHKALAQLPQDDKERAQSLETSFNLANQFYKKKEYDQAYNAFFSIWLAVGDYKGKTLKMKDKCEKMMGQQESRPAEALKLAAQTDPLAPPAAAKAKAVAAAPSTPAINLDQLNAPSAVQPAQPATAPVAHTEKSQAADQLEAMVKTRAAAKSAAPKSAPDMLVADRSAKGAQAVPDQVPLESVSDVTGGQPTLIAAKGNAEPVEIVETVKTETVETSASVAPPANNVDSTSVDDLTRLQVTQLLHSAKEQTATNNFEEARKNVLKALDMWSTNSEARQMLEELNKKLGYSTRDLVDAYVREGEGLVADQKFDEAVRRYDEALKLDPANKNAAACKARALKRQAKQAQFAALKTKEELQRDADVMQKEAQKHLKAGDVKRAREIWQKILEQDPQNKLAQTYMEETKADFAKLVATENTRAQAEKRSETAEKLLNAPVTISTEQKIALPQFMSLLSFATTSELEYYIAEGANAMIFANFVDRPLHEVLDTVLLPIGLSWSINERNLITIEPKMITRTYNLSPSQMSKIRALQDSSQLQKIVWNQSEPPAEGAALTLDERQSMLIVTGSKRHIEKIESLLQTLPAAQEQEMIMRVYKIKESDGPRIKSLINSIISADKNTPFDLERKIFVDKGDLIVKDLPENIQKIEELLLNNKFIQDLRNEKIDLANFSLVPRDVENINNDEIRAFTSRVVEAIKVFLYSQEGETQAAAEGRKVFYDPNTLQLTVVDTPTNIARVAKYIDSLPELGQKTRQDVIFLNYAVAEDLSSSLERILKLTTGGAGSGKSGGNEVVLQMRRGDSRQFQNLRIRVVRVEPNDVNDRKDDSVELSVNNGANVSQITLRNLDTQYQDEYELTAEDVVASSGQPGEGRARIRIRYVPQALGQQPYQAGTSAAGANGEAAGTGDASGAPTEDNGITINPFGELNAIIVRYTNPALYQDVLKLVEQLDKPTKQVQIETKFVEVNETRAKEFSADFNIAGLGSGRSVDWNSQLVNSRFGQDLDEFRDSYSPPIENPTNANLIKGTTVIDAVIGNFPNIQYSLRLLEAEGIINIINGPKVTALDGQEAEFRIEEYAPQQITSVGSQNSLGSIVNPLDRAFQNIQLADTDEANNQNMINAVVLRMTPEITSPDSIILNQLSAELIDFEGWLGQTALPIVQSVATTGQSNSSLFNIVPQPVAVSNQNFQMMLKRKKIVTDARIKNGGTIVIGGWTGERSQELTSGIPVLRNMPYFGKLLFSRAQRTSDRTTLLIFLTGNLIE